MIVPVVGAHITKRLCRWCMVVSHTATTLCRCCMVVSHTATRLCKGCMVVSHTATRLCMCCVVVSHTATRLCRCCMVVSHTATRLCRCCMVVSHTAAAANGAYAIRPYPGTRHSCTRPNSQASVDAPLPGYTWGVCFCAPTCTLTNLTDAPDARRRLHLRAFHSKYSQR